MPEDIKKRGSIDKISSSLPVLRLPEQIISFGIYHQPPGCDPNPLEIEQGMEVVEIVTGGRGWVEEAGQWREVIPGTMLWHKPGQKTITRSDWADPYRCLAIRFDLGIPERQRVAPRFTEWNETEEVMQFAREVIRWRVDGSFSPEALLQYTHGRLLFQVELWLRKRRIGAALPPQLAEALEMIRQASDEPLSLQQLARKAGWSVSYLTEMFRAHLGTTPHRFLMERRIRRAKERLVVTNDSVKEIAAATAFSSAAAFCHAFRQHVGVTPLDYRRRMVPGVR